MPRSNGRANCIQLQLVLFLLLLSITMALVISTYSRKVSVPFFRGLGWMDYRSRRTIPKRQRGFDGIRQREGQRELVGVEGGVYLVYIFVYATTGLGLACV